VRHGTRVEARERKGTTSEVMVAYYGSFRFRMVLRGEK